MYANLIASSLFVVVITQWLKRFCISRRVFCLFFLLASATTSVSVNANSNSGEIADEQQAQQAYEKARLFIDSQQYSNALQLLRKINTQYPRFNQLAAVQTRIAVLHEATDAGNALTHYLSALDKRDSGDADAAISSLAFIIQQYAQNSLLDDALYLKAYVEAMDLYDFNQSLATLSVLESRYPDSAYTNSANYLRAINLEQIGNTIEAISQLEMLRERHTALALPFGFRWPEGTVLSRYWYERADQRLNMLNASLEKASQLRSRQDIADGSVRMLVSVDGVDLSLRLVASTLTTETNWRDGQLGDRAPPSAAVYSGVVEGDDNSWVRAVLVDNQLSGMAYAFGKQFTLSNGTLVGTIDYYKPGSAASRARAVADSSSTEVELQLDGLLAPPISSPLIMRRASTSFADIRVVPISVVIDHEYNQYYNGQGLSKVLSQINVADGIYREFGVALRINEVQLFDESDVNPMLSAPSTLESYLKDFRQYRLDQRTLFNQSALTYLFTGKQATDSPLGLAWIDTLCRTDGYDVGITKPTQIGEVLFTHEVGHSLGALHDTDTACASESRKLMWPHISSRTEREFSSCSKQQLGHARTKACLLDAIDLSVEAQLNAQTLEVSVINNESAASSDVSLKIDASLAGLLEWPAGCQPNSPTGALCTFSRVGPSESRVLSLPVNNVQGAATATIDLEAEPIVSMDIVEHNNRVQFSMATQASNSLFVAENSTESTAGQAQANVSTAAAKSGSGALAFAELVAYAFALLLILFRPSLNWVGLRIIQRFPGRQGHRSNACN